MMKAVAPLGTLGISFPCWLVSTTMAKTIQYWDMADKVHAKTEIAADVVSGFSLQRLSISRSFFSPQANRNGFQAGLYQADQGGEKVVAFGGTQGVALNDALADVRLMLGILPRQASTAYQFFRSVVAPNERAVIVGHSLGGALAQIVGYWCNERFVTFNAPGAKEVLDVAKHNILKPQTMRRTRQATTARAAQGDEKGLNFVARGDAIGSFGNHIGRVIWLPSDYAMFKNHGDLSNHIHNFMVGNTSLANRDPFTIY